MATMTYWLMKSEPDELSIDDLATRQSVAWFGVRNYQARNFMRDAMRAGDLAFFYHSSCATPGIAGICEVCSAAHPDETQFDPTSPYFDAKASPDQPRWLCVDVRFVRKTRLIGLPELRQHPALNTMKILQKGCRLSITPLAPEEWRFITEHLL